MGSTSGFCYSDVNSSSNQEIIQNHVRNHQIHQGFESNDHHNPDHMFNLSTSMDMNMNMIGFAKHLHQQQWKPNNNNNNNHPSSSSSPKIISTDDFYFNKPHQSFQTSDDQNLLVNTWGGQDNRMIDGVIEDHEDSSLRCSTVFPCEGNERPSQGLSLSLSSTDPSTIGLQSFQLRHTLHQQQQDHQQTMPFHISNSKYLGPTQQLLNEFCGVETKQSHHFSKQKPPHNNKPWDQHQEEENGGSRKQQSLCSLEFMDLQKRKTKLLLMLEEVDRRYRHYCDQMKAVVSSFEAIAGEGAANVYSSLASKAMSRHFRCLRDGIIGQIQATKKAMGDKDPVAPGTTRGETPRLRILDQSLRQQKAFQQMTMMESHPWRPQRGLPERSVSVLRAWLFEHFLHPYPSDVDKHILARQTGLSRSQVSNWFINARVRLWKPMVEEMYMEEIKEHEDNLEEDHSPNGMADIDENGRPNPNTSTDQKPTPDQLLRIDHGSLSSIIHNNQDKNEGGSSSSRATRLHHTTNHQNHEFGSFGAMELDFSSYNQNQNPGNNFVAHGGGGNQNFNVGSGVSLTLGLQQHGGNGGVSLAFSPTSQSSLFYTRDHIEDCQQVQYSLLDGEGQNLPYRNLMGAQLLHDLAG